MKSKFIIGLIAVFTSMSMTSCYERVDAGYEGIKVNLYGAVSYTHLRAHET